MSDRSKEPAVIAPVYPGKGRIFDGVHRLPWALSMDDFSLVQTIDRLSEGIVVGVPDAADGRFEACFGKSIGVLYGHILTAAIEMMHQAAAGDRPSGMKGLFSSASRTKLACTVRLTRQPTMRRAKASIMKAT